MLKICLGFCKSEPQYAYKRYAYKKNMYLLLDANLHFLMASLMKIILELGFIYAHYAYLVSLPLSSFRIS